MSELLIVVAIVIVLFAVAVLSLVTIQKNLRQKELDSKAEILYVAAQKPHVRVARRRLRKPLSVR